MGWMRQMWWKWLSAALLLYVIIGGFWVPLGPGIPSVHPIIFKPDTVTTFSITTYNTHFTDRQAGITQVWFKNVNNYFCPDTIRVVDNNKTEVTFGIPSALQDTFRYSNFDIVINNDIDGTFALRDAVTLLKTEKPKSDTTLALQFCSPEVKNNKTSLFVFPYREILLQTIRNTFFHVPMWFAMTLMVTLALIFGIAYMLRGDLVYDTYASSAVWIAILFGWCGYFTGVLWSKYTWFIGIPWSKAILNMIYHDIKLAGALVAIGLYTAYFVVRNLVVEPHQRARISAVYNIFSLVFFALLIYVIPRINDSVHPGNGGNPAFSKYDLDNTLRMFFYPAVVGWLLFSLWLFSLLTRLKLIEHSKK